MTENNTLPNISDIALSPVTMNFESRKVQVIDDDTLRIKPTVGSLAFSLMFIVLGLGIAAMYAANRFTSFTGPGSFPLLMIGLLFLAAGVGTYYSNNKQLVINRSTGAAFIRSWHLSVPLTTKSLFNHIQSEDIIAIQTISRVVKRRTNRNRRRNSYTEFQVNLCTSDNERHNIFVTLKAEKADVLGNQVAQMFGVPVVAH